MFHQWRPSNAIRPPYTLRHGRGHVAHGQSVGEHEHPRRAGVHRRQVRHDRGGQSQDAGQAARIQVNPKRPKSC